MGFVGMPSQFPQKKKTHTHTSKRAITRKIILYMKDNGTLIKQGSTSCAKINLKKKKINDWQTIMHAQPQEKFHPRSHPVISAPNPHRLFH